MGAIVKIGVKMAVLGFDTLAEFEASLQKTMRPQGPPRRRELMVRGPGNQWPNVPSLDLWVTEMKLLGDKLIILSRQAANGKSETYHAAWENGRIIIWRAN